MTEDTLESILKLNGKTAPRITPEHVDSVIVEEEYMYHGLLTICVLTLKNGYKLIGTSSCCDPQTYIKDIGEKSARDNAREQIWALEGYLLKEKLYQNELQKEKEAK